MQLPGNWYQNAALHIGRFAEEKLRSEQDATDTLLLAQFSTWISTDGVAVGPFADQLSREFHTLFLRFRTCTICNVIYNQQLIAVYRREFPCG